MNLKKIILFFMMAFSIINLSAQKLKPTKKDEEKYTPYFMNLIMNGHIEKNGNVSDYGLHILDSLYKTDPNSNLLRKELSDINFKLIYNFIRVDRVPQNIAIIKSIMNEVPEKERDAFLDPLASLYRYSGDFKTAISYYTTILSQDIDSQYRDFILTNLIGTYLDAGENKHALETARKLKISSEISIYSMLAQVYYNNGLTDSALIYTSKALEEEKKDFRDYIIKAKIYRQKEQIDEVCPLVQKSVQIIKGEGLEALLAQRDKNNAFIRVLVNDVEEAKLLEKEYCH